MAASTARLLVRLLARGVYPTLSVRILAIGPKRWSKSAGQNGRVSNRSQTQVCAKSSALAHLCALEALERLVTTSLQHDATTVTRSGTVAHKQRQTNRQQTALILFSFMRKLAGCPPPKRSWSLRRPRALWTRIQTQMWCGRPVVAAACNPLSVNMVQRESPRGSFVYLYMQSSQPAGIGKGSIGVTDGMFQGRCWSSSPDEFVQQEHHVAPTTCSPPRSQAHANTNLHLYTSIR